MLAKACLKRAAAVFAFAIIATYFGGGTSSADPRYDWTFTRRGEGISVQPTQAPHSDGYQSQDLSPQLGDGCWELQPVDPFVSGTLETEILWRGFWITRHVSPTVAERLPIALRLGCFDHSDEGEIAIRNGRHADVVVRCWRRIESRPDADRPPFLQGPKTLYGDQPQPLRHLLFLRRLENIDGLQRESFFGLPAASVTFHKSDDRGVRNGYQFVFRDGDEYFEISAVGVNPESAAMGIAQAIYDFRRDPEPPESLADVRRRRLRDQSISADTISLDANHSSPARK